MGMFEHILDLGIPGKFWITALGRNRHYDQVVVIILGQLYSIFAPLFAKDVQLDLSPQTLGSLNVLLASVLLANRAFGRLPAWLGSATRIESR